MIKVSFIIPCYNEIRTIEKIINKIINLKNIRKEIIVVDDFSSDGSKEIIKKYEKKNYLKLFIIKKIMEKVIVLFQLKKK